MNKKKILLINYSLGIGGIETLMLEICRRIDKEKYNLSVCVFTADGQLIHEFENIGVKVHVIQKKPGIDISVIWELRKLIKNEGFCLMHSQNQSSWLYGATVSCITGVPLLQTVHTSADYQADKEKKWRFLESKLALITKHITTVAGSIARYMITKEGIRENKITVIHNGIKKEAYRGFVDVAKKRSELGLGKDDYVVGNVARFYPNKDHRLLLDAVKIMSDRIKNLKVLLAGDGPLRKEAEEYSNKLGLTGIVAFLGNRRDIPELLRIFDVFILSSKREGLPISLLEAMASGTPAVVTDVDGNSELVENGKTGFLVPYGSAEKLTEAVALIFADPELARDMSEASVKRIDSGFTFENMVSKYEQVYDMAIKK